MTAAKNLSKIGRPGEDFTGRVYGTMEVLWRAREREAARKDRSILWLCRCQVCGDTCEFCKNNQCYARGGTKPCLPKCRWKENLSMKRITKKILGKHLPDMADYTFSCDEQNECVVYDCPLYGQCPKEAEMLNILGEIEDILGGDYDIGRLRELIQADRDGRCVILPVKEGDMVYHIMRYVFEEYPPEIFEAPFHITDYYNIGDNVFLTEEEAEAALEGELNG